MRSFGIGVLFLLVALVVSAQKYEEKDFVPFATIGGISLRHAEARDSEGIDGFAATQQGFLTWERYKDRFLQFDTRFNKNAEMPFSGSQNQILNGSVVSFLTNKNFVLFHTSPGSTFIFNNQLNKLVCKPINLYQASGLDNDELIVSDIIGDLVILEARNGPFYVSLRIPVNSADSPIFLGKADTIRYIASLNQGKSGLHFDSDGFLWNGGSLLTHSSKTFLKFLKINHLPSMDLGQNDQYWGTDKNGNTYWGTVLMYLIFDKGGNLKKALKAKNPLPNSRLEYSPFIDFEGNIYAFSLSVNGQKIEIVKIASDW